MSVTAGQLIRQERRRRRWSQAALAARAGMSDAHVAQIEAGEPGSVESYARLMTALDVEPLLTATDPRQRTPRAGVDVDFVHAAMGEVEASRLMALGFAVGIDEPYQHYQFAGRADVVAWSLDAKALLHIENRTRFPNVQEALGAYASKRAYLGGVLAERLGVRGGWRSETHVVAALWTSEVLHVLRQRAATFLAACPDGMEPVRRWWSGERAESLGRTSSLVLLDPAPGVRAAYRLGELGSATRPRHRGYAETAAVLRDASGDTRRTRKRPKGPDH